ncbi:hypothetical protein TVAG_003590 [Trichomonas vaginalis G3]|uniref:Uncharacterized protein n=1 Tax=Trichomonas vaginalis (strain ATCC PRA-98 / G3) TaxID=412133 RepID=A2E573_TRIV3|nr:hypothetical protein TVAGG3_0475600 [Trichomonas vaginalis G3]EAY12153.1 hypothetical protein TVAG_003590 [Trichomonas vaginalis G3]KAI5515376.1 hypothetical protein TVAGG3_0475600 [Trichomonas vaginalis G3]|eukprot:XP_001324376.1 hypothetical protein [Trichomonas vaginalis G3]
MNFVPQSAPSSYSTSYYALGFPTVKVFNAFLATIQKQNERFKKATFTLDQNNKPSKMYDPIKFSTNSNIREYNLYKFDNFVVQFWDNLDIIPSNCVLIKKNDYNNSVHDLITQNAIVKRHDRQKLKILDAGENWCVMTDRDMSQISGVDLFQPNSYNKLLYTKDLPIDIDLNYIVELFSDYGCISADVDEKNKCFRCVFKNDETQIQRALKDFEVNLTEEIKS